VCARSLFAETGDTIITERGEKVSERKVNEIGVWCVASSCGRLGCCAVTVSCLARFAQPYRVVCNATIEAFFEGRTARSDVRSWGELLGRYQRIYQQWYGTLRMECGAFFGRSPPEENRSI